MGSAPSLESARVIPECLNPNLSQKASSCRLERLGACKERLGIFPLHCKQGFYHAEGTVASGVRRALLQPPLLRWLLEHSLGMGRVWLLRGTWDMQDAQDVSRDIGVGWGSVLKPIPSMAAGGLDSECIKSQTASSEEGNFSVRAGIPGPRTVVHLPGIFCGI